MLINLKNAPEIKALILAADPTYRKRTANLYAETEVSLYGTYWSGGSRNSYAGVCLSTRKVGAAVQYDPAGFGGPAETPRVSMVQGAAVVRTGFFCGAVSTATVYLHPTNLAQLLPA